MHTLKISLQYLIFAGLAAVLALPLFVSQSMYFPFIVGKNFAFRIFVEIIFFSWAILAIHFKEFRPKAKWLLGAVGLFTLLLFIADLHGVNISRSLFSNYERMEGFVSTLHLFLYFVVMLSVMKTEKAWKSFLLWNAIIGIGVACSGLGQLFKATGAVRLDATLGNSIYLAIYMLFQTFLSIFYAFRTKIKWQKWLGFLLPILYIIILYNTGTRGTFLGLLAGGGAFAFLTAITEKHNKKLKYWSLAIIAGLVLLVAVFLGVRHTSFVQDTPMLKRFADISLTQGTSQSRLMVWGIAWKGIKEKPILGWGQENFNVVFNKYYDPNMYEQEQWFDRTHNVILNLLVDGGILVLLSYLLIFASAIWYLYKSSNSSLPLYQKNLILGLLAGYFVHNLFVFDNLISSILFLSVLALIAFYFNQSNGPENKDDRKNSKKNFVEPEVVAKNLLGLTVPVAAIALFVSIYFVNSKAISANYTLMEALVADQTSEGISKSIDAFSRALAYNSFGNQEIGENIAKFGVNVNGYKVASSDRKKAYEFVTEQMDTRLVKNPTEARNFVFAGGVQEAYKNYPEAEKYFRGALALSPTKQTIIFSLANALLNQGKNGEALDLLKKAFESAPKFTKARDLYALALITTDQSNIAAPILEEQYHTQTPPNDYFFQAYMSAGDLSSALSSALELIKQEPKNYKGYLEAGQVYFALKQSAKAQEYFSKAAALNPSIKGQ